MQLPIQHNFNIKVTELVESFANSLMEIVVSARTYEEEVRVKSACSGCMCAINAQVNYWNNYVI